MADTLFVPLTCAHCQRTSALEVLVADLDHQFASSSDIEMRCSYDNFTWNATPRERRMLLRLWQEHKRVSRSRWMPQPVTHRADLALS